MEKTFAACAGRYSAEVEHGWLMQSPDTDRREARRDAFVALLDAMDSGRSHMTYRIAAKAAQARLLRAATFERDTLARADAERHLTACAGLLLGG